MLKKPSVNHVSEHLSMMSPVYTQGEGKRISSENQSLERVNRVHFIHPLQ